HIPGITFYPGARGPLNDNVEFDKLKFAAYANTVTMAKLVLLQELPVDGQFQAGQISALFKNLTGAPYDARKLILNGAHGGNILTATLPKPGQTVQFFREDQDPRTALSDTRPWLALIDGDHQWRTDSQTSTGEMYRHHAAGDGSHVATWTLTGLAAG